ncbi:MAG: oligosaccharide flippase family protein [Lachnospiraceae bacterium]|nr:oligosaccharide flippase family protein [Lachnospiraceae bacterium]
MFKKHPFLFGTFLLTLTGLLSRIIGFFYRIFLSKTIGEEGMGIYQLLAPVMTLSFSLCSAGIQTAVSKYVAGEPTTHDYKTSSRFLLTGLVLSLSLAVPTAGFLYHNAALLAGKFLLESRCEPLLRIFALSIPFAGMHSCINGYYYGIKNTAVPSAAQLIEQLTRVGSVYLIHAYCVQRNMPVRISVSVIGLTLGEIAAFAFTLPAILYRFHSLGTRLSFYGGRAFCSCAAKTATLALPLCANRIVLNVLQSVEAVHIPNRLLLHGLTNERVLCIYGVLTGMAIPLILFPNTLTGSVSVLLLPYISESQESHNDRRLSLAVRRSITGSLLLGFICTAFFFFAGRTLGNILFDSVLAGSFIRSMSFICPFLYLGTVLGSILHGLGKAGTTFLCNSACLLIRLSFVFLAIPRYGISGYLWGLLLSEILLCLMYLTVLRKWLR